MNEAKYVLIIWFACLFACISSRVTFANSSDTNMPDSLVLFSEHLDAFYAGHDIKLLNIHSKHVTDVDIKTYSYGDFYIVSSHNIAWIGEDNIYTYNASTNIVNEKALPTKQSPSVFLTSISPGGNKIAYLSPYGKCLYVGGESVAGQRDTSLGNKSKLHILDLENNNDRIVTSNAFDWGPPQWSPDETKVLYCRPGSDNYFSQDYLNEVKVQKNCSWQSMIQGSIFVYDLRSNVEYRLCSGIKPQWSPDGNRIAFLTGKNKIGIYDLRSRESMELPTYGSVDVVTFKIAWSADGKYIAYLGKPRYTLISYLKGLSKIYERASSLWIAKTDGTHEEYVQTRNFGDIKYAPQGYSALDRQ